MDHDRYCCRRQSLSVLARAPIPWSRALLVGLDPYTKVNTIRIIRFVTIQQCTDIMRPSAIRLKSNGGKKKPLDTRRVHCSGSVQLMCIFAGRISEEHASTMAEALIFDSAIRLVIGLLGSTLGEDVLVFDDQEKLQHDVSYESFLR